MNLKAVDLNLLKVFEALAEERSTTRAGIRVGLTQASVSNALGRLRQTFNDELFVRTPEGMTPTPRAEKMVAPVRTVLDRLRLALAESEQFDPASATGVIRIAMPDIQVMVMGPKLAGEISRSAPNIELRFSALDNRSVFEELDQDRIDLAISVFLEKPKRFVSRLFERATLMCLGRVGHPAFDGGLTPEDYVSYPHVMVSFNADSTSMLDTVLARRGLSRRVAVTVGDFLSLPAVLEESDYLASIPTFAKRTLTQSGSCEAVPLPIEVEGWPIDMLWSRRADADPLQAWGRTILQELSPAQRDSGGPVIERRTEARSTVESKPDP